VAHPNSEELLERLRLQRELAEDCPALAPNLQDLGRLLQVVDEPGVDGREGLREAQQWLERAVQVSDRSAPALVELGYFLDAVRDSPDEALRLYEEGASKALETLADAWVGMIRYWTLKRTKESLGKALALGALAESVLPDSERVRDQVAEARWYAAREGLIAP
jgi:hypothetical protein